MEFEQQVLTHLFSAEKNGMTWKELQPLVQKHHGHISGTLSGLHSAKKVFRLTTKRKNCQVYVHWKYRSEFPDNLRIDTVKKTKAHQALFEIVQAYDAGKDLLPYIVKARQVL